MLSKYPIALLGVAIPIFLIVDRQSRRWLFRREPYWGALIALILFSPVVLWNIRNDWISFAFQGSNRWTGNHHFGFHILIGSILLLLTPTGLFGIVRVLLPRRARRGTPSAHSETAHRQYLWTVIFVLAPLSVFVVYSLINVPKLNWTAPVWLAAIPLLARDMGFKSDDSEGVLALRSWRLWAPTIVVLLFIHGGFLNYVSLGLPGAGPMVPERLFGAWRELANKVDRIESAVEAQTGAKPIVVGMDKNFISSELSFYHAADKGGPFNTGRGSHGNRRWRGSETHPHTPARVLAGLARHHQERARRITRWRRGRSARRRSDHWTRVRDQRPGRGHSSASGPMPRSA
jgi:dolichol-phosphate mannosyltransferase